MLNSGEDMEKIRDNINTSISFFCFLLEKINMSPKDFCEQTGWTIDSYWRWKSIGIPKRAWKAAMKELELYNYRNFHRKYKDDSIYIGESEKEYINTKAN